MGQGGFREYDVVRIVKLLVADRRFDGSEGEMRSPEVGDEGTIVIIYNEKATQCIVECMAPDGMTTWLADFDFEELEFVWRAQQMDDKLNKLISDLGEITDDARNSFGHLSGEQLNWKPTEKGWSVAQCMEHLILTNSEFFTEMDGIIAGTRKNSFFENYSPLTGWWGRFLIKAVTEGSRPASAPSKRIVPPSDISADIVDKYCSHQEDLVGKISQTGDADWEKTVLTSPFLPVMTYKMADAYVVLVEHSKRHLNQAKRVTATEGFPA